MSCVGAMLFCRPTLGGWSLLSRLFPSLPCALPKALGPLPFAFLLELNGWHGAWRMRELEEPYREFSGLDTTHDCFVLVCFSPRRSPPFHATIIMTAADQTNNAPPALITDQ